MPGTQLAAKCTVCQKIVGLTFADFFFLSGLDLSVEQAEVLKLLPLVQLHAPSVLNIQVCVAVCCGVLRCVAVCCGALRCVAVCCMHRVC